MCCMMYNTTLYDTANRLAKINPRQSALSDHRSMVLQPAREDVPQRRQGMSRLRRIFFAMLTVWLLVATNPDESSFSQYLLEHSNRARRASRASQTEKCSPHGETRVCVRHRRAFPALNGVLKSFFGAHGVQPAHSRSGDVLRFKVVDCAIFTVARAPPSLNGAPPALFFGALGRWVPAPSATGLLADTRVRGVVRSVMRGAHEWRSAYVDGRGFSRFNERKLPRRPWEWLLALFVISGFGWFLFPQGASNHFTLTWENVRLNGRWWCMVLFHLSHGGSVLRLARTVASLNYLAPVMLARGIVSLSDLYGVVLTGSALSTALGMLVLARRYVFGSRSSEPRTALEINGGGGCVYALLVAACLSSSNGDRLPGGIMPFELLMLNVAFDAFFLAGQKRIADYTAHAGAALGAWLFCSISALR